MFGNRCLFESESMYYCLKFANRPSIYFGTIESSDVDAIFVFGKTTMVSLSSSKKSEDLGAPFEEFLWSSSKLPHGKNIRGY